MYPLDYDMEMACSDATWNGTRVHYCSVGGMEPGPTACVGGMEPRPTIVHVDRLEPGPTIAHVGRLEPGPMPCVGGMEPGPTARVGDVVE